MRTWMPSSVFSPTINGSTPKYRRDRFRRLKIDCGTTLEITQAFNKPRSSLCIAISCESHTTYSSAVRVGSGGRAPLSNPMLAVVKRKQTVGVTLVNR